MLEPKDLIVAKGFISWDISNQTTEESIRVFENRQWGTSFEKTKKKKKREAKEKRPYRHQTLSFYVGGILWERGKRTEEGRQRETRDIKKETERKWTVSTH